MANKGMGSAAMLAKIQLTRDCLELRKRGDDIGLIADKLGISAFQVRKHIETAVSGLESVKAEEAETLRELEMLRIDALYRVYFEKAMRGDNRSLRDCLGLMELRSRLAGLNKPIQIEQRHIIEEQISDEHLRQMMAEAYDTITVVGEGSGE